MNWPKEPSIIRKKLSDELTVLLHKGDLPSDSSDEEYVPSDGYNSDCDSLQVLSINKEDLPETCEKTNKINSQNSEIIAKRTRSKLPLTNISIESIERQLTATDTTANLYNFGECDDELWEDFLKCIHNPPPFQLDDDDDDPEYTIPDDEITDQEYIDDDHTEAKRRKIDKVLEEIQEIEKQTDNQSINCSSVPYQVENHELPNQISSSTKEKVPLEKSKPEPKSPLIEVQQSSSVDSVSTVEHENDYVPFLFDEKQSLLFETQIRSFIQLLVQDFIICYRCDDDASSSQLLNNLPNQWKEMLRDSSSLFVNGSSVPNKSFNRYFYQTAVHLVEEWESKINSNQLLNSESFQSPISREKNDTEVGKNGFTPIQEKVLLSSWIFLYPNLLPEVIKPLRRPIYSISEDRLIASKMKDFTEELENDEKYMKSNKKVLLRDLSLLISRHYFPHRDPSQIFSRVQTQSKKYLMSTNPINVYHRTGKLPPFQLDAISVIELGIRAPVDRDIYSLPPAWRPIADKMKKCRDIKKFTVEMSADGSVTVKEVDNDGTTCNNEDSKSEKVNNQPPAASGNDVQKKKLKMSKKSMNCMLTADTNDCNARKADNYVQAYFDKVRRQLRTECMQEFEQFVKVLNDFDERTDNVRKLYEDVDRILRSTKNFELSDEFVSFLTPNQANEIAKFVPHCLYTRMLLFLNKLEIYYKHQPGYLGRMLNIFNELIKDDESSKNLNLDKLQAAILPSVKGNSLLCDWFMEIFPEAKPPQRLMTDWEVVDLNVEPKSDVEMFETVTLPEIEDPYGGPNCKCDCHEVDDAMFQNRNRHCVNCGLKFIHGKIFVQMGKSLKPAQAVFTKELNRTIFVDSSHSKKKKRA